MAISTYLKNLILDKVFRNTDFTISNIYLSLHVGDPGITGGNEASGMSYARQPAQFTVAFAGETYTSQDVIFTHLPSGIYGYVGVWNSLSGGNYLWGEQLLEAETLNDDDGFILYSGGYFTVEIV